MRYMTQADAERNRVSLDVANISASGSVKGMQQIYGWPKGGQVRVGGFVYNVGVVEIERARSLGILKGE